MRVRTHTHTLPAFLRIHPRVVSFVLPVLALSPQILVTAQDRLPTRVLFLSSPTPTRLRAARLSPAPPRALCLKCTARRSSPPWAQASCVELRQKSISSGRPGTALPTPSGLFRDRDSSHTGWP